ncbi:hypothetical protein GX51_05486 [Blastomyces parvus]|uniref:Hydrophobin n=1 Tax=Blastomyces parvus TaxID=2060905 RepID=A0A2B7WWT4_9EURO|nr:hypothetical protein GX51_05486 [Blastomyces parvus]
MPSLNSLLPHLLLFTTLYTTLTSAESCIGADELEICCPGSLFGGLISDGKGKPTARGICCIDPSAISRRSIGEVDNNIVVVNEALHRRQTDNVDIEPTTCSDSQILIQLSATDYSQQVSSVMASITGDPSNTNTGTSAPTTAGDSSSTTTTSSSTGGMPAATGQRSYAAAIGGVVAAAALVAGGL